MKLINKFEDYNIYLKLDEDVTSKENVRNVKAYNKFRRCFTLILTNYKFFAALLFNLKIVEVNAGSKYKTMATDGKILLYNPDFVNKLTEAEIIFVILHELLHCANLHFGRMSGRDPNIWNQAADYAINIILDDMRKDLNSSTIKTPDNILLDEKYRNMSAEQIYDDIYEKSPPQQKQPSQGPPPPFVVEPGQKVRIKSTGKTGIVREIKNGKYIIDEIQEEYQNVVERLLFERLFKILNESSEGSQLPTIGDPQEYDRDEFVPIVKAGDQPQGQPGQPSSEDIEIEGEQQKGGKRDPNDPDPWVEDGKGLGDGSGGDGSEEEGEDGEGSGKGDDPLIGKDIAKPGTLEGEGQVVYEGNTDLDKMGETEVKEAWKKIRIDAASQSRGTGSSSFDRWVRKTTKPKVNWKNELRKFVSQIFSQMNYGFFNKRFISNKDYLPGLKNIDKSVYDNVVIAIDTSGSINDVTLGKFGAELESLFKKFKIKKCHIIWCDSEIKSVQTFDVTKNKFKLERLVAKGGGGTSFFPPFVWIQNNIIKKGKTPAFFIYFTDAYGDAPKPSQYNIRTYQKRILWVVTDNEDASNLKFGKKIYLDKLEV